MRKAEVPEEEREQERETDVINQVVEIMIKLTTVVKISSVE